MKIVGALACGLLALECAMKALGVSEQVLFPDDLTLLWLPPAAGWLYACILLPTAE